MTEKTVANGVVRILMDATEDVIGEHGLKALLNFAKMPYLFENKPDYGYDDHQLLRPAGYPGREVGLSHDR
jgi:hypothetical protein